MSEERLPRSEFPTTEAQRRGYLEGLVVPPLAWLVQLQANYALAPWVCSGGTRIVLIVILLAALVATAVAGLSAWRSWPGPGRPVGEPHGVEGGRLLAILGVAMSASFLVVLLSGFVPTLLSRPCG